MRTLTRAAAYLRYWRNVYGLPMTDLHPHIDKPVNDEEIVPPYNRVKAIGDIEKALICPLSLSEVFRIDADASFEPLDLLRQEMLKVHVRGAEGQYVGAKFVLFELDTEEDDELQGLWTNVCLSRESARNAFCAKLRRFTDLRYASREEYGKHLPPLGSSLPPDRIDADASDHGPVYSRFRRRLVVVLRTAAPL